MEIILYVAGAASVAYIIMMFILQFGSDYDEIYITKCNPSLHVGPSRWLFYVRSSSDRTDRNPPTNPLQYSGTEEALNALYGEYVDRGLVHGYEKGFGRD